MDKTKLTQRLCNVCANGAVLRGHARNNSAQCHEEVICLVMGRVIEIDVTECSRYEESAPKPDSLVAAQADTAWVA